MNASRPDILALGLRLVEAIEALPSEDPDLGSVLGAVAHAVEARQAEIARRVIERTKELARAGAPSGEGSRHV